MKDEGSIDEGDDVVVGNEGELLVASMKERERETIVVALSNHQSLATTASKSAL